MKSRRTKPGRPDSAVIIESWRARAETAFSRHELRRRRWVALADVARAWRRVVAWIARFSETWPAELAAILGRTSLAEAAWLPWADTPRVPPAPPAAECAAAEALIREWLSDPGSWPRVERDALAVAAGRGINEWIARRTALHFGIEMSGGLWHRPATGRRAWLESPTAEAILALDMTEAGRRYPQPFLRPRFAALSAAIAAAPPAFRALEAVLASPRPIPLPAQPKTSAAAREQYLHAQAMQARLRTAVERGGYVRREAATEAVTQALATFRVGWWSWHGQCDRLAGDEPAARASAEALRSELLEKLSGLDGMVPPTKAAAPKTRRPKRRGKRSSTKKPWPTRRTTRKTTKRRLRR